MARKARTWKCRKCAKSNPRRKQKCLTVDCVGRRPAPRRPKHKQILEKPYEWWAEKYGETCNICGRRASSSRRLDRDHCHASGNARGLLCARCNRALPSWIDADWLERAAEYLRRPAISA